MNTSPAEMSNEIVKIKEYKELYNKKVEALEKEFEPIAKEVLELTKTYLEKNAVPIGTRVVFNDVEDWMDEEGTIIDYHLTDNYEIRYYFDAENFSGSYRGSRNQFTVKE